MTHIYAVFLKPDHLGNISSALCLRSSTDRRRLLVCSSVCVCVFENTSVCLHMDVGQGRPSCNRTYFNLIGFTDVFLQLADVFRWPFTAIISAINLHQLQNSASTLSPLQQVEQQQQLEVPSVLSCVIITIQIAAKSRGSFINSHCSKSAWARMKEVFRSITETPLQYFKQC